MRIGQHLLAGLLLVVGAARAIAMGDNPVYTAGAAVGFTVTYWFPVVTRRPERPLPGAG